MPKTAIAIVLSLIVGIGIGVWVMDKPAPNSENGKLPTLARAEQSPLLEERLRELERMVGEERDAREVLEEQLLTIFEQIEGLEPQARPQPGQVTFALSAAADASAENRGRQRDRVTMAQRRHERRVAQFVENGFSREEAGRLIEMEAQTQFELMQDVYDAQRRGESPDFRSGGLSTQSRLRAKLGDAEYERFLVAQGQRTNVQVSSILDGSPGSTAGLQPGDEIVSYNGRRTFTMSELRELTMGGEPGEDVVVEIDREGVRMQLSIPRGPIGMNGNGASVRIRNWWGG